MINFDENVQSNKRIATDFQIIEQMKIIQNLLNFRISQEEPDEIIDQSSQLLFKTNSLKKQIQKLVNLKSFVIFDIKIDENDLQEISEEQGIELLQVPDTDQQNLLNLSCKPIIILKQNYFKQFSPEFFIQKILRQFEAENLAKQDDFQIQIVLKENVCLNDESIQVQEDQFEIQNQIKLLDISSQVLADKLLIQDSILVMRMRKIDHQSLNLRISSDQQMQSQDTRCEDDKMEIDECSYEKVYTDEQIKSRAEAFMAAMELIRGDEPAKEIEFSESDDYYIDESDSSEESHHEIQSDSENKINKKRTNFKKGSQINGDSDIVSKQNSKKQKLKNQNCPEDQTQQTSISEEEKLSKCGNYRYYINSKGIAYIQCKKTNEIAEEIYREQTVFKSLQILQDELVDRLSNIAVNNMSFQYKYNITSQYVHIKCKNCQLFSFWMRNQDKKQMNEFCSKQQQNEVEAQFEDQLDLVLYRKINMNHDFEKHSHDISF